MGRFMQYRHATIDDATQVAQVEALGFPPAEAASLGRMRERLRVFPNHYWLAFDNGELASFVGGMVNNGPDLLDELYANAMLHDEGGDWFMIFSVVTSPAYEGQGLASELLGRTIEQARDERRKGVVLTCKRHMLPFYSRFGFVEEFLSSSTHGGATWYQMRLSF